MTKRGPLPVGYLGFQTDETYVDATINPMAPTAQPHAATHEPDGGFHWLHHRFRSHWFRMSKGITRKIRHLGCRDHARCASAAAQSKAGLPDWHPICDDALKSGPVTIIGTLQTNIREDGTFEFPAVTPGTYTLSLTSVPEFSPMTLSPTVRLPSAFP